MAEAASSDSVEIQPIEDTEPETVANYKAPAKKTIDEINNLDADDESLVNYKKTLLNIDEGASPADDPRKVIVESMSFVVEGRDDEVMNLTGDLKTLKLVVKEGTEYKIKIGFKIHHEIVAGLRYHHVVKRKGVNADKQTYMVGSYGPKSEQQSWLSPIDEAPKGMIYRGNYKIHSKFIDDDKVVHLEWDWEMDIKKDWADEK